MKFKKAFKDKAYIYSVSNRKVAAYHLKIKKAQDAYPLFADAVAAEFAPAAQVMNERVLASVAREKAWRDNRAAEWKRARAKLRNSHLRKEIYAKWQASKWLENPVNLLDMIWTMENPGIHHIPAWAYPKPQAAQIALSIGGNE